MTKNVYLIVGVPGSGKSWVTNQLKNYFTVVPHDDHADLPSAIAKAAKDSALPILTEAPFGETTLRAALQGLGLAVRPHVIVEPPATVSTRYVQREGRPLPKQFLTRAGSIKQRALEWLAPHGTSDEVLKQLRIIGLNNLINPGPSNEPTQTTPAPQGP